MIEYTLWGIFGLLLIYYSTFLLFILRGLNRLKPFDRKVIPDEFVSVIVPFRNEEENIAENLKGIITQDYPKDKFEVIYVNDNSADKSLELLSSYSKPSNIKVISVPNDFSPNAHKKRAIRYGIENSKGEIIVTTDADCFYSENWLRSLLSNINKETGFVSGPVEFIEEDSLFSKLQKLEFAGLVLTGAGLIGISNPTICNAANTAYRKEAYETVNGFYDQMDLSSGDDELLMQKIAKDSNYKIKFSLNRDSIVRTKGNSNLNQFYQQRKRWASKGLFYKNYGLIFKLIMIFLFYLGLIIQPILTLFLFPSLSIIFTVSLHVKFLIEYLILNKGKVILFTNLSLKYFPVAQLLQIPYIIIAGIAGLFGNLKWKGRKIKR